MANKTADCLSLDTDLDVMKPRLYDVVIHNDDYTTMETVAEIFEVVFHMASDDSLIRTLEVHLVGFAVVGPFSFDIAETKQGVATEIARSRDEPLLVSVEPRG